MKKVLIMLAVSFLMFQTAHADFKTGNDLVVTWREYTRASAGKPYNDNDEGFYTGYVAGVCDANMHTLFHIPEGTTIGQACEAVGTWLDKHPEEWNKPGKQLVIKALKEAFPISKDKLKKK